MFKLRMIATDGVSLHLVFARPLKKGETAQKGDEEKEKPELPAAEHAGLAWHDAKPKGKSVRQQTILASDGGVKETTVTRAPNEIRDAVEDSANGVSTAGLDELVRRDNDAKVRGNRQLCKGNWDAVARPKQARAAEKKVLDRLNVVLAHAGTSVQKVESTLRDLASVTGVEAMREAIVQRARAAPILFFAYFHPVYRDNRRKRLLALKRHAEQLVGALLETAVDPATVEGTKEGESAPLWRKTRVQLPPFSEETRSRQQRRSRQIPKNPSVCYGP